MKVFVYGTLRPGESAARILGPGRKTARAGVAAGRLLQSGYYGADFGDYEEGVPGYVVDVDDETLMRLDRYEGGMDEPHSGYRRVSVKVHTLGGIEECFSYEWTGAWGDAVPVTEIADDDPLLY